MIKLFKFLITFFSNSLKCGSNSSTACFSSKCFSKFLNDDGVLFLNDQMGNKKRNELIQRFSCSVPFIRIFPFWINLIPVSVNNISSKFIFNPFNYFLIGINNLNSWKEIFTRAFHSILNVNASLSINHARQIANFKISPHFSIKSSEFFSEILNGLIFIATLNDLGEWHCERNMRKSDLALNAQEENRKRLSRARQLVSHKSNSLPVLNSAAARLGQALRETQDALQRDNLESSASIINCVGGTNGDIPTEMTISDVDDVFTVLQNNSGEYITNIVEAELRFGTSPIGDAYGCMLTTRMIPVLYNMSGFVKKFQYPNISQTLSVEIGGANNVRFFASEQGSVSPNASLLGNYIVNCFFAAKEAYKVVWQAGGKARFIYLPPGYNNDPCMLRHTAGCSFYQGQCIDEVVHFKSSLIDLETYGEQQGD